MKAKKSAAEADAELAASAKQQASIITDAGVNAAAVLEQFGASAFGQTDISSLMTAVASSIDKVKAGNLGEVEGMLMGQAIALQSMFMSLSRRANGHQALRHYEAFFRLALKAQSQCRATIEALAAIKHPPVVFARQANIANGPQQVNNSDTDTRGAPVRAQEHFFEPNKLLEASNEQPLDTRAPGKAGSVDAPMPTMA